MACDERSGDSVPKTRAASHRCLRDPELGSISSSRCQKSRMRLHREVMHAKLCLLRGRCCCGDRASARVFAFGYASPFSLRGCFPAWLRHAKPEAWWSQTGSNRRPPACKAGALPAELWPLKARGRCPASPARGFAEPKLAQSERRLVGLGRLELPTSRLSSARSNQLSYKP